LHRFRVNGNVFVYLKARKRVGGRVKEVTLARISLSELEEAERIIKEVMGTRSKHLGNNSSTKNPEKPSPGNYYDDPRSSSNVSISSSKPGHRQQGQIPGGNGDRGGVGGSACGLGLTGLGSRSLFVHRIVLRFVRPWVSPLYLSEFGGVRFIERSKQWIVRLEIGLKRWVTVQVNRDGTAQVYLEASGNPPRVPEEVLGFACFFIPWLFRRITGGKNIDLEDFIIFTAPELNIDLDGANLLEGLGARCLTLKDLVNNIVRIYYSDPGVKITMPNGGTRIEIRPKRYEGMSLKELVEGITATAELPQFLLSLKKEVEEVKDLVKGGVSLKGLEKQGLADLVATKLANYLEILWRRIEARLQQWIRDLAGRIAGALQDYVNSLLERIRALEEENKRLRKRIQELEARLKTVKEIDEYKRHPAWRKLEELATPSREFPALIIIDLEKGMVYYSPELWRYIRSRTPAGTLRGLDRCLLVRVRDYHGEWAVKLLLAMQMYGGKMDMRKALDIITRFR